MIHFSCPRCGRAYEHDRPGVKFACACGQKVEVPCVLPAPGTPKRGMRALLASRWKWPAVVAVLVVVAILLWGGTSRIINSGSGRTFTTAEKRAAPRCAEEEKVKAWILAKSPDPASVTFVEWGPHDLRGELDLKWLDMGQSKKHLVRVVYRANDGINDVVFILINDEVFSLFLRDGGKDWLSIFRRPKK